MLDSNKDNLKLEAMKRIIGVSNTAFVLCTDISVVTAFQRKLSKVYFVCTGLFLFMDEYIFFVFC